MKELTYEQAIQRLDFIITTLENNKATLDESIELYKEAIDLINYCENKLQSIDKQMTQIYENNQLEDYQGQDHE